MQPNEARPAAGLRELTLRGLILGALITLVFTAANVYLGLKVGLTFASSIPAAVISMVVLRLIGGATILENNIVQTQASAAGTLSAIIFVIPGLIMVGHWHGVPWVEAAGLCAAGGVLGVLFTIPLRRALVVESALPFPEGVAAAEVLRLGESSAAGGARELAIGGVAAAIFNLLSSGFAIFADSATASFSLGGAVFRLGTGFSLALVGAGYLMGIAAGVAILVGVIAGWGVALPILTAITPVPAGVDAQAFAMTLWRQQVRFIGAGTIAIAAVWTLGTLVPSIARGLAASFGAARRTIGAAAIARTDRDIAGATLLALAAAALLGLFIIFMIFLGADRWALALYGAFFAAVFGFLTAAACGYMAGIVGSSASPISGIGIIAVSLASLTLLALPADGSPSPVAVALFITSAIVAIATISNDNLQDLKTGQLVEATPANQQIALIIGVLAGAVVIPPLIDLLYRAYGFAGALPRPDMDPSKALAAPQATLMSAIANGVLGHKLDWTMIGFGFAFGAGLIVIDLILKRTTTNLRLPALAAGIGLYLPASVSVTLVIGAVISWIAGRALSQRSAEQKAAAEQRGVLLASGLIVGESLIGVIIAAIIGATGRQDALAMVGPGFETTAIWLGAIAFFAVCIGFARLVVARAT
jgi:putative OPT family oligopeptide transporter